MSKKIYQFVIVVLMIIIVNMAIILPFLGDAQPGYTISIRHMFTGIVVMFLPFVMGVSVGGSDD